jgi:hypothetical protein
VWLGFCLRSACFMLACVFHSFLEYYMRTSDITEDCSGLAPAQPPQLRRISMVERQHIASRALGPLDAACTMHRTDRLGTGSCGEGSLRAWLGLQAFYQATAFNANIGAWNTASMTTMDSVCALNAIASGCEVCASCLLVCFTHFSSIRMPSAAADRGCSHACFCRASLISRVYLRA